jgi:hypothetical protein
VNCFSPLDGEIKTFQDKEKLKHFMSTKFAQQKILRDIKHMEENGNQSKYEKLGKNKIERELMNLQELGKKQA